jgi:hypothetical protein
MALRSEFADRAQSTKVEQLDATYRYSVARFDQTCTPVGESALEFVMRKLPLNEVQRRGRFHDEAPAQGLTPNPR